MSGGRTRLLSLAGALALVGVAGAAWSGAGRGRRKGGASHSAGRNEATYSAGPVAVSDATSVPDSAPGEGLDPQLAAAAAAAAAAENVVRQAPEGFTVGADTRREALDGADPQSPRRRASLGDWAELLRVSALFTVPGDALAGAAASGTRPRGRTLLAIAASLCLYEAGMALNDWADREVDAVERPHRPIPSGRITPVAALIAGAGLTVAGLGLAALAGRRPLAVAGALAATVWAYDLGLKNTPAGPAAMAGARSLDLLLGAVATSGRVRPALASSALLGAHTFSVTTVSRREAEGGSTLAPLTGLAVTAVLSRAVAHGAVAYGATAPRLNNQPAPHPKTHPAPHQLPAARGLAATLGLPGPSPADSLRSALAALYALTVAQPLLHALLNPSPELTQRAVGGGIRAMIPLQAALAARAGHPGTALATASLAPLARRFARKVSVT